MLPEHGICDQSRQLHNLPLRCRHGQLGDRMHDPDHDWRFEHIGRGESEERRPSTYHFPRWLHGPNHATHGIRESSGIQHGLARLPNPGL